MNQYQPHSNVTFEDRQTMNKFINANKANPFITRIEPVRDSKDTLQVSFRDEQSKAQFESKIDESIKLMRTPTRIQKKKQTLKAKPVPGDKVKKLGSTKTMLKAGKGKHDCASKVEHAEWGVGSCIREQHAAPDAEGNIAWYDVMFEHGLEKQVSTDDLDILISEMHHNHEHHEDHDGEELDEKVSSLKKSDAPFTVVATKGGRVLDQMNSIELSDVKDAIKFMKTDKKGAKISVESKGGKVVHTESRDRFDYLDRQAASADRAFAAKKFTNALKRANIKHQYNRFSGTVMVLKKDLGKAQSIGKKLNVSRDGVSINVSMSLKEQPEHEITVGNYTTKFFYMCGSAQKTMKKHANKEGAEQLTKLQDDFYKLEKAAMDAGGASDAQKTRARSLYSSIMSKAKEVGIEGEVGKYMKMHLDSMTKGDPKLGFGRTDISESRFDPSKNPTAKVDKEFDDARNALRKAGIPHMGQRAIDSMNRERNKFRVHPKFEKKARQALKRFPKVGLEINDKMPEKPMVRSMKEDVQLDEMSAKAHYNKMKAQGKVGRGGRVVTPIDRNRFPNREREGLEGPFRNRKTSLIYYYDKKAGKYYDPQSDMYLAVKDVMDSVEEGLRQDLKKLKKNEGLRQAMSGPRETPAQKRKRKEKDNFDLYKKKQNRAAALRGDKSSRKLTPGQEKHYRQTVNLSQIKALSGVKKESVINEANDPHMVTELYLFITNDSNLNRQMIQSLIKNYRKKLSKGSYDETLAIKGFMNVVNAGIKAYAKEFSVGERLKVSKADRQEVAKKLSTFYRDEIMHGY